MSIVTPLRYAHIGNRNYILANRVCVVLIPNKFGVKLLAEAKKTGKFINTTSGAAAKSLLIMDDGTIVNSVLNTTTVIGNLSRGTRKQIKDYPDNELEDVDDEDN